MSGNLLHPAPKFGNRENCRLSHQESLLMDGMARRSEAGAIAVTLEQVKCNPDVQTLVRQADAYLHTLGYTDHGHGHVGLVAARAMSILRELGYCDRLVELAGISGQLHDIGNAVHRFQHAQSGAIMALNILLGMGMDIGEATLVANAVANHDEHEGEPVSAISAALIIADKSDVRRSRVRGDLLTSERKIRRNLADDIHDRVNYAVEQSELKVDVQKREIDLFLKIDTSISRPIEYFEIFLSRMQMSRKSAKFINCELGLFINDVQTM